MKTIRPEYKDAYLNIFGFILIITTSFLVSIFPLQADNTQKTITFEVTVPTGVDANAISLEFPKLKYNKKIICSWTTDDSYNIWNNIFSLINKKYVSNEVGVNPWTGATGYSFFYHLGMAQDICQSSGFVPSKFLEYTDGAGVKHRFASTVSAYQWDLGERDYLGGVAYPWVTAKEARLMADFGFTLGYHDLQDYDGSGESNFDAALAKDSSIFLSLTDRVPKVMIEPNGDHKYLTYSQKSSTIQMMIAQSGDTRIKKVYPFKNGFTLNKADVTVERTFGGASTYISDMITRLQIEHDGPEELRTWLILGKHRTNATDEQMFLNSIESRFGASGDDSVWFPSIDEFFEYWYMKEHATVKKEVEGQKIRFTLDIPVEDNFYFQSLSVLLNGISTINGINVASGDNVFGTSFGINDNKLLINLDFNESLPERAERYVSIYEKEKTTETYEDAMYFVSQLKPELKEPYINRINTMLTTPVLTGLSINNGAERTGNSLVSVSFSVSETAAYYRISESPDFENANWLPLVTSTLYNLSSDLGNKTIYIQLKNALYESKIVSAQIELIKSENKVVVGFSGDNQTNKKEFVNGEMLNNINLNVYKGWKAVQLYDTSDNPLIKLAKDTAEIKTAMDKYGISERISRGTSSLDPSLSGDEGVYPDRFIKYSTFFGSDTEMTPENRRLIAGFLKVPNGVYDVRVLGSRNGSSTDFQNYRYQANNSLIYTPESDFFNNNNSKFIEIKNVIVDDSTLLVCSWREPFGNKYGYYAPMNLIEIKPSISTSIHSVIEENKIKIYSGKGKLIIKSKELIPLNIYSIEGRLIKQLPPTNNSSEVYLPAGIYIINDCKGIVY